MEWGEWLLCIVYVLELGVCIFDHELVYYLKNKSPIFIH